MRCDFHFKVIFIVFSTIIVKTVTADLTVLDVAKVGFDYVWDAVRKVPSGLLKPPANNDESIQYILYTPNNTKEPCLIQPSAQEFDKCSFNPSHETKFLIHGFVSFFTPESLFNVLKDAVLGYGEYNVIIVDWTHYNTMPFRLAYRNAKLVGEKVAEMMKFMESHSKTDLKTIHCIGHSLGSHICGVAGRNLQSFGRITGLDPGGLSMIKGLTPNIRLNYTDADFVDVMHTSDVYSFRGLGYLDPCGHLDFYPNGGVDQTGCSNGNTFKIFNGKEMKVSTVADAVLCNHFITIEYYIESLKGDCKFIATECKSYSDFEKGECSSGNKTEMGFLTKKMDGIPPLTKFYLKTNEIKPYCQKQ